MKKIFHIIARIFSWTWKFLTIGLTVISSLVLISFLALLLQTTGHQPLPEIPYGTALVFTPRGDIVEKRSPLDPVSRAINNLAGMPLHEELFLQDAIDAIRSAATDDRIKLLVINADRMGKATLDQLQDIGRAIESFKNTGKIVIAAGDSYNQGQYYLASWSDEIYLNPMGAVTLQGFGVFRLYIKELLDKLAVNFHIFKVGTFKSALEPFIRTNMSAAAKKANTLWLEQLWTRYCNDISKNRGIPPRAINNAVNKLAENIHLANGNAGKMAVNNGLVDGLKTRQELRSYLKSIVGDNTDHSSFQQVGLSRYLATVNKSYASLADKTQPGIGIIVAQGNIVYGEGSVGQIGADTLIRQIQKVRKNKKLKALILRVDSGGGSAFASELIRQELLETQKAGKPVIISMGSMAASGAYWISADADAIFASPTTLTGSIGIFGALPTFERSLAKLGVYSDGTGTTDLAGAGNPARPLPETYQSALQLGVEYGYRQFIDIVAKGRKLTTDKVEKIAEGRVWDGTTALEIGLVDHLGNLEDAIVKASELAEVPLGNAVFIQKRRSPAEEFFKNLGRTEAFQVHRNQIFMSLLQSFIQHFSTPLDFLAADDPKHLYSHCLLPSSQPFGLPGSQ